MSRVCYWNLRTREQAVAVDSAECIWLQIISLIRTWRKFAAPPQFEVKLRNQTARKDESAVLQCEAKGEKPIGILWNMNNKRLDPKGDNRYIPIRCGKNLTILITMGFLWYSISFF